MVRLPRAILRSSDNAHIPHFGDGASARDSSPFSSPYRSPQASRPCPGRARWRRRRRRAPLSESAAMSPVEAASTWLREQQDASGGFFGLSGEPDPGTTTDAVMALYAAQQRDPAAAASLDAALAYLEREENGAAYARDRSRTGGEAGPGGGDRRTRSARFCRPRSRRGDDGASGHPGTRRDSAASTATTSTTTRSC